MAKTLNRRTLLKGVGAALGLPLLEAMLPTKLIGRAYADEVAAAKKVAPQRMLFISQPNGVWMDNFKPATVGPLGELPATLKALEPFRKDFSVLSGLACDNANAKGDGPGDHARSSAAFLTGAHPRKTKGSDIKLGVSVDQFAAARAGQTTRLPSIELGCDAGRRAGDCDSGYSCAYVSNVSWVSESVPMPKLTDPAQVFDRIFGKGGENMLSRLEARKSILDFVSDETKQLQNEVGIADQRKIDEFTNAVREVERRIEQNIKLNSIQIEVPKDAPPHPDGIPKDYAQHIRLMYDMLALAFQTDVTRIGTFLVANEGSNRNFGFIGATGAHHENSHHGANAAKIDSIKKIDKFYYEQFAYFIKRLKETKDAQGSLLDNCMVVIGSGIGDGDRHNHDKLPILLAGGGGGTLKQGRHIDFGRQPLCNLFVSMLDRMGVKTPRFGDSTGALEQLS